MNFAVVYLGEKIPTYVYRNLAFLKEVFPSEEIYFVSDCEKALARAAQIGVTPFKVGKSEMVQELDRDLTHPKNFRGNFWVHTTSRFFALSELVSYINEPLLQIEADVFLLPTFPVSSFLNLDKLAYPLESPVTGAASLFFIPNPESILDFLNFILESISKNGSETDMTLLGKYWQEFPERVEILPSIPAFPDFIGLAEEQRAMNAASKNVLVFGGLFDPLTYGMHLLGEDPQNNFARTIFGKKPEAHLISKFPLEFQQHGSALYLIFNGNPVELFCLHVHSKNLRIFDLYKYKNEIADGIRFARNSKSKISIRVFLKLVRKWVTRRLRGRGIV